MDVIHTYGGGHMLYEVFNVIAMICKSDSPYWTSFMYPALLVGGLWAAVTATAQANLGIFAKKWFVPTYALLLIALVPKTHLNIIDEVDPTFASDRVDNIPVGLAVIATVSSSLSRGLTEIMEDAFETTDLTRFTKTGFAFSSRLTREARTMRIKDSRVRQNVKDWADQCVWLPYLKTNIRGKREAVRKSEDILTWVQANGHPSLGIYWRNEDGSREYKTCRATAIDIRAAMEAEGEKGLKTLGARLFGLAPAGTSADHLRPIMQEAWQLVSNSTRNASQQVQQMMVVNAQKEAFDDAREAHRYPRLHPELVSMNAARNLESQGMGGFMKNVVGETTMPLLQGFLLALLSVMFLLVIPFAFMPGGLKIFAKWARMMFAIQLWPVFSTILNALSLMMLQRSTETVMDGSTGFSIATTSGLADAAFDVAGQIAGMQLAVPLLAWGFVSGGQFAITQIMQSATGGMDAGASRMAAEAADGNLSMGNQNLMNETIASRSVAQQNNVGSHNYAETLNTGSQVITQGENGEVRVQENQDTLRENFSSSGQLSSSIGNSVRDAKALTEQQQNSFNKSVTDTSAELLSFTEKVANGTIVDENATASERAAMQKAAEETLRQASSFDKSHGVTAKTAVDAGFRGSLGTGAIGRLAGIELTATGGVTSGAENNEAMNKVLGTNEGIALSKNLTKMHDFATSKNSKLTDSSGADAATTLNHSLNKTQSTAEAYSRAVVTSKNWEKTQALNDQNTVGTNANDNDQWLSFLGDKTGRSRADLVSYINQGGSEVEGYKSEFLASKQASIRSAVENSDHIFTDQEVQRHLSQTPEINSTGRAHVQSAIDTSGLKTPQYLNTQFEAYKKDANDHLKQNDNHIASRGQNMLDEHKVNQDKFEYENSRTNMARSDEKTMGDLKTSAVGIYEDAKDLVGLNAGNYDNPLEGASSAWNSKNKNGNSLPSSKKLSKEQKDFDIINKGKM
jgi:conjugal transfer mating pair stabilization protein TraG